MTLFEWLCGSRPYPATPSISEAPQSLTNFRQDVPEKLAAWLLQAIQPLRENRFEDIQQMKASFENVWTEEQPAPEKPGKPEKEILVTTRPPVPGPAEGNPFVNYLNTLHNTTAANPNALAESQALNPYFGSIHVPLALTDFIERELTRSAGNHVILTGHAGDGKSTIGLELYKRLKQIPMTRPLGEPLKTIEKIGLEDGRVISLKCHNGGFFRAKKEKRFF